MCCPGASTLNDLKLEHLLGLLGLPGLLAKMPRLVAEKYQKLGKQINKLCLSVCLDTVLQSQLQLELELAGVCFWARFDSFSIRQRGPRVPAHTHPFFVEERRKKQNC